ncbi:response regulator [Stigmatella sp. ncwal1]|uniref:Response regulator n=1 Tax=Stigmatella ashevillensis TaxID=2995309 RepID=A0ABT5DAQ4_9BACT|nr:response regulator [Stigmatella ashevillena]MDC0710139.1 response regulator [Stigmatella ashevillena]
MVRVKMPCFLFVDQNPLWLSALGRATRDLPGSKLLAHSAEEALSLLRLHAPEVVVSGYCLPEVDGLSLLEQMKNLDPRIACVLHTAQPPELLRSARGIALVEKAAPPGTLLSVLRALYIALTGQLPASPGGRPGGA